MRAAWLVLAVIAGCAELAPTGAERAACRKGGRCDDGLECVAEVCLRPPGPRREVEALGLLEEEPPPPRPRPRPAADAGTTRANLPSACRRYFELMKRYASCDALPPESRQVMRDAVEQAVQAMEQSWAAARTNGTDDPFIEGACQQGADAMADSMRALGCSP